MSRRKTILESVAGIVEGITGIPAEQVAPGKRLLDDLEIDSLALVEMAVAVGETFQVDLLDKELKELRTVHDLVVRIARAAINA
jgi:acyl carrier protein